MKKTELGNLHYGDTFYLNGIHYRGGHVIGATSGYVACTDIDSGKVTRIHIDVEVEVEQKGE